MFLGEHSHSIDDKGRISTPAKFRRQLTPGVVVTRGLDRCLWIYPRSEWEKIARKLADLPITQKKSRAFARLMLAGAWDVKLDTQGRIMLPEYLRTYAGLKKHATIAGLFNRLEVWDEDAWQTYRRRTEAEGDQIAESLAELGI
ncbi:MAG: division/cell wall cluster transcriptional repressor MraZ [bacterium]